jgi:MFS family permease
MSDTATAEDAVVARVMRRLLPFLLLMYMLAFLDRANIGFAQKALQHDTGLSNAAFAFGAGVFFVGYALFEVPSNLLLHRVGAKLWMCRIMVTWGIVSASMAFAHTATMFYVLRFALGVAEAGFFPGIVYYLTRWFPQSARARALGVFYFGAPLAFIFGSPLSGALLDLHGAFGFAGWQWLFLVEGVLAALIDPRVLILSGVYFLIQMSVYGVIFYLPQQVAALLGANVGAKVGFVTAIPWLCAVLVTWVVPRYADRHGQHRWLAVLMLVVAGAGIAISGLAGQPVISLIALCFAASGLIAAQPLFWTFPTHYLTGAAAAGAIALINSLGGLGGFVAPMVRTAAERIYVSTSAGLVLLGFVAVLAALAIIVFVRPAHASAHAHDKPHDKRAKAS